MNTRDCFISGSSISIVMQGKLGNGDGRVPYHKVQPQQYIA